MDVEIHYSFALYPEMKTWLHQLQLVLNELNNQYLGLRLFGG